jgi:hypothetical protein
MGVLVTAAWCAIIASMSFDPMFSAHAEHAPVQSPMRLETPETTNAPRAASNPSIVRRGFRSVGPAQQRMQLLNALKRFLAAFVFQNSTRYLELTPQFFPAVERDSMSPTGHDGRRVCLWFGELVAFMRDRTLNEGKDFG